MGLTGKAAAIPKNSPLAHARGSPGFLPFALDSSNISAIIAQESPLKVRWIFWKPILARVEWISIACILAQSWWNFQGFILARGLNPLQYTCCFVVSLRRARGFLQWGVLIGRERYP